MQDAITFDIDSFYMHLSIVCFLILPLHMKEKLWISVLVIIEAYDFTNCTMLCISGHTPIWSLVILLSLLPNPTGNYRCQGHGGWKSDRWCCLVCSIGQCKCSHLATILIRHDTNLQQLQIIQLVLSIHAQILTLYVCFRAGDLAEQSLDVDSGTDERITKRERDQWECDRGCQVCTSILSQQLLGLICLWFFFSISFAFRAKYLNWWKKVEQIAEDWEFSGGSSCYLPSTVRPLGRTFVWFRLLRIGWTSISPLFLGLLGFWIDLRGVLRNFFVGGGWVSGFWWEGVRMSRELKPWGLWSLAQDSHKRRR